MSSLHSIQQTLIKLQEEEKITTSQMVICLTIPLTKKRFLAEKNSSNWWSRLFCHSTDFARNFSETFAEPYWVGEDGTGYEQRVALPVLQSLLTLNDETQVKIVPDCTFQQLKDILDEENFRLLIILAHHYNERIEFAGGGVRIAKIKKLFASFEKQLSLCLLVCESESTGMALKDSDVIRSLFSSPYELSVVHAAKFLVCWVKAIDCGKTLSQSYHEALHNYKSIST
ncbi:MAG: hypothetical protein EOP48_08650 [Sphingobacteriales bacterium]|nr:MAG: hypothetical protein EOP48_08650 [Sphingobacteriales bacterium]